MVDLATVAVPATGPERDAGLNLFRVQGDIRVDQLNVVRRDPRQDRGYVERGFADAPAARTVGRAQHYVDRALVRAEGKRDAGGSPPS